MGPACRIEIGKPASYEDRRIYVLWLATLDLTQEEIATRARLGQATVSRILKAYRKSKVEKDTPELKKASEVEETKKRISILSPLNKAKLFHPFVGGFFLGRHTYRISLLLQSWVSVSRLVRKMLIIIVPTLDF